MISRSISLLPVVQASCRRCLASLSLSQRYFSKLPLFATTRLITVHEYHSNKKRTCVETRRSHSHELIQEYSHQDSEDPQELCKNFLTHICDDIKKELNSELVPLRDLSHYLFDGKGKYIRPQIVFLFAVACNKTVQFDHGTMAAAGGLRDPAVGLVEAQQLISDTQKTICMIAEMIHTASLIHDDVIDGAALRRGSPTLNRKWGETKAVVTGDYVLSVASGCLSRTQNPTVVQLLSQVVEDLVRGEFMQLGTKSDETLRFNHYLEKTYKKTASLLANSCKAVAVLAGSDDAQLEAAFQFGRNLGIAFQLIDDLLDIVSCEATLGKPAAADLQLGLATAPVLFALDEHPDLSVLILRRFSEPGDVVTALDCVNRSKGIEQTRFLSQKFSQEAVRNLETFVDCNHRRALLALTQKMLHRNF